MYCNYFIIYIKYITCNYLFSKFFWKKFYISFNKLREDWVKKNSTLKDVRFPPAANPEEFSILQNSLISDIHSSIIGNNLFIDKKDKKSGIISLLVKSENELFSNSPCVCSSFTYGSFKMKSVPAFDLHSETWSKLQSLRN